ncbi:hypothetical protein BH24ACT5_BH24ACT5_17100 [soil metagenome]
MTEVPLRQVGRRRLLRRTGVAVAVWALIVGFMAAGGLEPQPVPLAAAVAALVAAGSVVSDLGAQVVSANWTTEAAEAPPPRGADPRVERLERRIEAATDSGRAPEIEGLLARLVIDQADAAHGVSPEQDVDAFTGTVGPELAALVARHGAGAVRRSGLSTRQIHDLTEQIEAL